MYMIVVVEPGRDEYIGIAWELGVGEDGPRSVTVRGVHVDGVNVGGVELHAEE